MPYLRTSLLMFFMAILSAQGQQLLRVHDTVPDLPIRQVLNYKPGEPHKLSDLQKEITIIDFFGTWCSPCIRALPNLTAINEQFSEKVSIVLVSTEEAKQLQGFIKSRPSFSLPVVVDHDSSISAFFLPPSYPYTVVLNKNRQVLALPEAISITPAAISAWLNTPDTGRQPIAAKQADDKPYQAPVQKIAEPVSANTSISAADKNNISSPLIKLSQEYIYAAKTGSDNSAVSAQLNGITYASMLNELTTDAAKKTFWINIYNGFVQFSLRKNPEQYKKRSVFFRKKQVAVAGHLFSLDDIEHGILRRSKIKWSLGYLNRIFPGKTERELRVNKLDYRIHFALNCGAKSCPPIAFYQVAAIDQQLDIATIAYLRSETIYHETGNELFLPAIMGWFRRDFGGKKHMRELLRQKGIIQKGAEPAIHFRSYDWSIYLDNYKP